MENKVEKIKSLIKDNWFKFSVVAVIIFFGIYYFRIISDQNLQKKISDCRNIAEEYKEKEKIENPEYIFFEPKYIYNKKLKTCLYSGGYFVFDYISRYIKDLHTNNTIVEIGYTGNEKEFGVTVSEFEEKEDELFR